MKIIFLASLLFLSACTVQLKDDRIDPTSLIAKLEQLDKINEAIVLKLKELQDKGVLSKPKE